MKEGLAVLTNIRMAFNVAGYNFRTWHKNTRIIGTFIMAFILCFFLTDKVVDFAVTHEVTMQLFEPFVWTFGDSHSILLSSLLLLMLFSDMPFITPATPLYLVRGNRRVWVFGQILYIMMATCIYMVFILLSTVVLCMRYAYTANIWSRTAAILAYSDTGEAIAVPALVKTLEMSRPYACTVVIFGLMLLYALVMGFVMLLFNVWKGTAAGVVAVLIFDCYGLLLNPQNLENILKLPEELAYKARVYVGWISPLNHATYHMHNFGYDRLPTLNQTALVFGSGLLLLVLLASLAVRRYNFEFK